MDTQKQMLFSRRDLMRIVIPLALQGILSVAIGMVDSMMVSNKGEDAFDGVSLVGSLDIVLITLFGALTSGGSVIPAQILLLYHSVVSVILRPTAFCLPPAFRAANDVLFTMIVSTFSMWFFRVAAAYLLTLDTVSVFGLFTIPAWDWGSWVSGMP